MDDTNFKNNQEKIINALKEKIPNLRCPACSHVGFGLAEGYFAHDIQPDLVNRRMGGPNVPTVPLICTNCGYVMEFAAGALNLLPKKDEK